MSILKEMSQTLKNLSEGYNSFQELMAQVQGESKNINQWEALTEEESPEEESSEEDEMECCEEEGLMIPEDMEYENSGLKYYTEADIEALIDSRILERGYSLGIPADVYENNVARGTPGRLLPIENGMFEENY